MNPELEALILARDAAEQAESDSPEADRLLRIYTACLDDLLQRRPGLARGALEKAVGLAHNRWLKAQAKPSSLPPKA